MIESKDIIFSSSSPTTQSAQLSEQQKITKISNKFIDRYLRPILTTEVQSRIQWINPEESQAVRYEGRYHWHRYREVI